MNPATYGNGGHALLTVHTQRESVGVPRYSASPSNSAKLAAMTNNQTAHSIMFLPRFDAEASSGELAFGAVFGVHIGRVLAG